MPIEITLGGALLRLLPEDSTGNVIQFDSDGTQALAALLAQLGVGPDERLMIILNGDLIMPERVEATQVHDGDRLSLMPPIQAG